MKRLTYLLISGLLVSGFSLTTMAQQELPEITIYSRNYKYLKAVNSKEVAQPVNLLERRAAAYNIKNTSIYEDDYDNYTITFYLPEGYVLAVYDKDGKIIRTAEKFKDIDLPLAVRKAIADKYPEWILTSDVYIVNFSESKELVKYYKIVLRSGDQVLRLKANERGEFIK
ncbi:MAG TPA: nicotinate-nucleotide adenylyltransferase [Lacibacter sp.]|nr:nicotinate-nucleotide adenylyltransferase [Lacibacter sp.]